MKVKFVPNGPEVAVERVAMGSGSVVQLVLPTAAKGQVTVSVDDTARSFTWAGKQYSGIEVTEGTVAMAAAEQPKAAELKAK